MRKHTKFSTALLTLFLLFTTPSGIARTTDTVTLNISGKIDRVDAELSSDYYIGDLISGYVVLGAPSKCNFGNIQCLDHVEEIDLKVGKNHFYSNQPMEAGGFAIGTSSLSIMHAFFQSTRFSANGIPLFDISMGLSDYQGSMINRRDFIYNQPDYSQFNSADFTISYVGRSSIDGTFKSAAVSSTSFALSKVSSVPEPSFLSLICSGLAAFLAVKKRSNIFQKSFF